MILKIKNKIQSESGVSFLFALLTFLVAAMVSVTIVTAASTTMKSVHNDRKEQQELLTLTSAAQLIKDEMSKTSYVITKTTNSHDASVNSEVSCNGTFAIEMKEAVEMVKNNQPYASDFDAITLEVVGSDIEMQKVVSSFTMSNDDTEEKYKVVFTIRTEQSGKTIFLSMMASEDASPPTTSGYITTEITTISWGNPEISSLGK